MIFVWLKENHSRVFEFGKRIHGLKHKSRRPDIVFIDKAGITCGVRDDYLARVVHPSLKPLEGKIVFHD